MQAGQIGKSSGSLEDTNQNPQADLMGRPSTTDAVISLAAT
jgi:hypothetical protein